MPGGHGPGLDLARSWLDLGVDHMEKSTLWGNLGSAEAQPFHFVIKRKWETVPWVVSLVDSFSFLVVLVDDAEV